MPNVEKDIVNNEKSNLDDESFLCADKCKSTCNTWNGIWVHFNNSIDGRPLFSILSKESK